jgi:hypothetical protein
MGMERHYASPPKRVEDFAEFANFAVNRYVKKHHNESAMANAIARAEQ